MTRSRTEWVTGELWGVSALGLAIIHQTDDDWIDAITNAVLIQRRGGGGVRGAYVGQLQVARTHFERGDVEATYKAMNRLMGMLEARANGVPAATADWPTFATSWCWPSTTMSGDTLRNSRTISSVNPAVCSGSSF